MKGVTMARKTEKKAGAAFTYLGVDMEVPVTLADDWEFLERIAALQAGDPAMLPQIVKTIAGGKYDDLKQAVRAEHGYVSAEAMAGVAEAALSAVKEMGGQGPNS